MDKPFSTIGSLKKGHWKHEFINMSHQNEPQGMLRRQSATVGKGQVNMETENLWMKRLGRFKIKLKCKHCIF